MSWFLLSIASVIFYSLSTIVQRKLMKDDSSDPVAYMVVFQLLVTIMILIYMIVTKTPFPTLANIRHVWINLLVNGTLISLGSVTMFQALKFTKAGEYSILSTISAFVNLVVASIFLHESLTLNKIVGTLLIVASVIFITELKRSKGKFELNKGHFYSLISAVSFGAAFANDSYLSAQLGVIQCLLIIFFIPGLIILALNPGSLSKFPTLLTKNKLTKMFAYSLLYLLGAITLFGSYTSGGDAGKIYGISNSSVIVTVILAAMFLRERDNFVRKFIATVMAFSGILLLR